MMIGDPAVYPNALGPVTLYDGTVVDPNTAPGPNDCLAAQCTGWGDDNYKLWCAMNGQVGTLDCVDPRCTDYCLQQPYVDIPAPLIPYGVPNAPGPGVATLTPQNIVQPLPDMLLQPAITPAVAVPPPAPPSFFCEMSTAVAENPQIAVLALIGVALLFWKDA